MKITIEYCLMLQTASQCKDRGREQYTTEDYSCKLDQCHPVPQPWCRQNPTAKDLLRDCGVTRPYWVPGVQKICEIAASPGPTGCRDTNNVRDHGVTKPRDTKKLEDSATPDLDQADAATPGNHGLGCLGITLTPGTLRVTLSSNGIIQRKDRI